MESSERFAKLKQEVEDAERNVRASSSQTEAELRAKVDEARKSADQRAAKLRDASQNASTDAHAHWREVQGNWDQHVHRLRERVGQRKAERDVNRAERHAEWAEADAGDAIDFAAAAIEEAEYAILDAELARLDADALVAS